MKSPSTPNSSSGAPAFERQDLPVSFQPRPMDVIIGRGKQVNKHNDKNGILQDLLQTFAGDYLYGKKERKSELLTIVVQEIRATGCAFIKKKSPTAPSSSGVVVRWYSVDETAARNSAAQFLRNHLCENYKSSKQFKKKLRMDKKKKNRNADVVSTSSSSSDGTPSMTSSSGSSQSSLASCEQEEMPLIHQISSSSKSSNYSHWKLANIEDEPQQTDSLVSLLPPHRSSRHLKESDNYDFSFPTNTTTATRRVSGTTYHSKLLGGVAAFDHFDDEASPLDYSMDAIMNMDLSTQDLFEPRPIGSSQPVPGSVFQSTEDEDLFLSWSSSVL